MASRCARRPICVDQGLRLSSVGASRLSATSSSSAARQTSSMSTAARQSGIRPRQRIGGSRMRLQGLHHKSVRTTREASVSGA